MWTNHWVWYCLCISKCSVVFIIKNADLWLGWLLCVYYQKCGLLIRFSTVLMIRLTTVFIRISSVVFIIKNADFWLGLVLCLWSGWLLCVYYQKCRLWLGLALCLWLGWLLWFISKCSVVFITKNADFWLVLVLCLWLGWLLHVY